uniref:signal peptidase I n=1 Tax=Acetatifactor sp. TaxID=1872090 RepID=UPI004056C521
MKVFSKICSILSTLILILFAAIAAVLILPVLFGCKSMAVVSGSMEPAIPVGSIIIVKEAESDALEIGDVVTYQMSGNTMVTHRIVEIDKENQCVTTKGDANEVEDGSPVAYSQIVGKEVFHVPYLGYLSIYIKTPLGIVGVCAVLMVLILLNFLPSVFGADDEEKTQDKKQKEEK